jgi:cyclopropane fatty-acyl-phospholipid synthase-like methyltransferase
MSETKTAADVWSAWLLHRRFGGDAEFRTLFQSLVEEFRDRVLDGARLALGLTLLDVGAGDGLISLGALQRVAQSFSVIVSDKFT